MNADCSRLSLVAVTNSTARPVAALYRSVDYEYGGGVLAEHVGRFAESASALLDHSYTEDLAPELMSAVAGVRQLAGWTAFDAATMSGT